MRGAGRGWSLPAEEGLAALPAPVHPRAPLQHGPGSSLRRGSVVVPSQSSGGRASRVRDVYALKCLEVYRSVQSAKAHN